MKKFIYLNSNKSGLGDRLLDLMLVYTYSQSIGCQGIYLYWTENDNDTVGTLDQYSQLRHQKTPFRQYDYLLKNMLTYVTLPTDIHFTQDRQELEELAYCPETVVFKDYLGIRHTLDSFMSTYQVKNKPQFRQQYLSSFQQLSFKNIPQELMSYFQNHLVVTVHLRRGDKVADDRGISNNITNNQLEHLNNLTRQAIQQLDPNKYHLCLVSDEKAVRDQFLKEFRDQFTCVTFEGDEISQTYFDLYCLVHSQKIILSQIFSVFSIFASMFHQIPLEYLLEGDKIKQFTDCYPQIKRWCN